MKKLLIAIMMISGLASAQIQTINVGTTVGDGTGDGLRTAMQKVNANFTYAMSQVVLKANSADVVPITRTINSQPLSANITLTPSNLGLNNVNNTADADKPVSTAAQTALDLKVDKTITVNGQPLSSNVSLSFTKSDVGLGNADNTSDANKPVSTAQQTALDLKRNLNAALDEHTSNYTLTLADNGKEIKMNSASDLVLTVPLNSTVPYPVNATIPVWKYGTGSVSIAATVGATINSSSNSLVIERQYSGGLLKKIALPNDWLFLNGTPSLTWTPLTATITGYASGLSYDISYVIEGKMCTIHGSIGGTGNTAAVSITNMPAVARITTFTPILVINNVTQQIGRCDIVGGTSTLTFYAAMAGTGFTNNVSRSAFFTVTYEIQ